MHRTLTLAVCEFLPRKQSTVGSARSGWQPDPQPQAIIPARWPTGTTAPTALDRMRAEVLLV